MKPAFPSLVLFVALAFGAAAAPAVKAPPTATPAPRGFEAFRLVRTVNIFDPERRPIPRPEDAASASEAAAAAGLLGRSSRLVLTGTMVEDNKAYAFFSGSRTDFNKVLPVNSKIADCTVKAIEGKQVELEENGKKIVLAVGNQLSLDGSARVSGAPLETPSAPPAPTGDATATAPAEGAPAGGDSSAPAAPAAPASQSDVVRRRMMENAAKSRQ